MSVTNEQIRRRTTAECLDRKDDVEKIRVGVDVLIEKFDQLAAIVGKLVDTLEISAKASEKAALMSRLAGAGEDEYFCLMCPHSGVPDGCHKDKGEFCSGRMVRPKEWQEWNARFGSGS